MIFHETVDKNCVPFMSCGVPKFTQHEIDNRRRREVPLPISGAERQRISIRTAIVRGGEPSRPAMMHAVGRA